LVTERDRYERESAQVRASERSIETERARESERARAKLEEREREREKAPVNWRCSTLVMFWCSTPDCTRHYLRKAQDAANHIVATPCV